MEAPSVRDYSNNLNATFDRVAEGNRQQKQCKKMADSIRRSWTQIKQMEAGEIPAKSAMSFLDEL